MRPFIVGLASALLLFNAIGAFYGGWNFISEPDGSSMQMSTDLLKNSPFRDYLFPGIILFVVNGLFSLVVLVALSLKYRHSALLITIQGIILVGWIVIQVLMIQTVISLHLIMGSIGLALFLAGYLLMTLDQKKIKIKGI